MVVHVRPSSKLSKALGKFRAALYRDRILREAFENEFQGLLKK